MYTLKNLEPILAVAEQVKTFDIIVCISTLLSLWYSNNNFLNDGEQLEQNLAFA